MTATHFSDQQQILLKFLSKPYPVPTERVINHLYGSRIDGGPEDAAATVNSQIYRLRAILAPHGIAILTIGGRGRYCQGHMVDPDHVERLEVLVAKSLECAIERARVGYKRRFHEAVQATARVGEEAAPHA